MRPGHQTSSSGRRACRRTAARRGRSPMPRQRGLARPASRSARAAAIVTHERDGHRQQEPRALEEREVGAVEVDAEVGGARARRRASAGRNGRMPAAAARPSPWRMSRTSFTVRYREARHDCRRQARRRGPRSARDARAPCVSARDLERYAGLFAARTRGHEVLGDARPHGDHRAPRGHLAGRRPARHLDLPGRVARRAACRKVAADATPRARCSTARPRAWPRSSDVHRRGHGRRGHGRRPRGRARHHRRPAGHRPRLQDAHRPRRRDRRRGADLPRRGPGVHAPTRPTSCRSRWTTTACAIDELEETLDRLEREGRRAEVHLHDPELPEPGRRDDVAAAPPAARRGRRASASCSCSRTTPTACCATRASRCRRCTSLDGGEFVIYLGHVLEDPLARHPPRLGGRARAGAREDEPRQAGRRPVLVVADAALRRRVLRARATGRTTSTSLRDLYRAPARHDARRARRALPARGDVDAARRAGCSSGRRCPTTSTRPTCSPARCRATSRSSPAARRTSTAAAARRCG